MGVGDGYGVGCIGGWLFVGGDFIGVGVVDVWGCPTVFSTSNTQMFDSDIHPSALVHPGMSGQERQWGMTLSGTV